MRALPRFVKSRVPVHVRHALRDLRTEWYVHRIHRAGLKKARTLSTTRGLCLNLGSGCRPRHGWINVDLSLQADVTLDLREPLPFGDGTVHAIYTEHFLEHLNYPSLDESMGWRLETEQSRSEALTFLRECHRVLVPGGMLDVVVPDAECLLTEYVARHEQPFPRYEWWGPSWCDTPLHCVNYVFRQGRDHKYAYDHETLHRVLDQVGFENIARRSFDPALDAENHAIGSLCVRALKTLETATTVELAPTSGPTIAQRLNSKHGA